MFLSNDKNNCFFTVKPLKMLPISSFSPRYKLPWRILWCWFFLLIIMIPVMTIIINILTKYDYREGKCTIIATGYDKNIYRSCSHWWYVRIKIDYWTEISTKIKDDTYGPEFCSTPSGKLGEIVPCYYHPIPGRNIYWKKSDIKLWDPETIMMLACMAGVLMLWSYICTLHRMISIDQKIIEELPRTLLLN